MSSLLSLANNHVILPRSRGHLLRWRDPSCVVLFRLENVIPVVKLFIDLFLFHDFFHDLHLWLGTWDETTTTGDLGDKRAGWHHWHDALGERDGVEVDAVTDMEAVDVHLQRRWDLVCVDVALELVVDVVDITTTLETWTAFFVQVGHWNRHLVARTVAQEVDRQGHVRHNVELQVPHDGLDRGGIPNLDVKHLVLHGCPKLAVQFLKGTRLHRHEDLFGVAVGVLAVENAGQQALFPQPTRGAGALGLTQLETQHIRGFRGLGSRSRRREERRVRGRGTQRTARGDSRGQHVCRVRSYLCTLSHSRLVSVDVALRAWR